jgi:hypothetical protein
MEPADEDWLQEVRDREPLRQLLQGGEPENPAGFAPSGQASWGKIALDAFMGLLPGASNSLARLLGGAPPPMHGMTRGNPASFGGNSLAAQGFYAQLTSNRDVSFASAQNATPVRHARSADHHSDDPHPEKFMEDLSDERAFYTMLFSPGLKTLGYEPNEKFEFDVTTRDGDRHIEERKTLTAVGVVRYLLVRKDVEKLQGLTKRGRDLVFEVKRYKGKQANELFKSKKAVKRVQHHSAHRGVKAIERLLADKGIKGTDKATLRHVTARERTPLAIALVDHVEADLGAVLDVQTRGRVMSFAILPTTDELIRYLGDPAERNSWVTANGGTFFSSRHSFKDRAIFSTVPVEGTEDQPLNTVSSCLRQGLLPVIGNRMVRQHGVPPTLLE